MTNVQNQKWAASVPYCWHQADLRPNTERFHTFRALSAAFDQAFRIPLFQIKRDRYIILSDLHKGDKQARSDEFCHNETLYCRALEHYLDNDYRLILNGDVEEGWKAHFPDIIEAYRDTAFEMERRFVQRGAEYYIRIYGNHDDDLADPGFVSRYLKPVLGQRVRVYAGLLLGSRIFIAHGHQGELNSDRRAWLSRRVVRHLWRPLQRIFDLKHIHTAEFLRFRRQRDEYLYEWAWAHRLMMIASHTHRPMFAPEPLPAEGILPPDLWQGHDPRYFNTGCCVNTDGITGIELDRGEIRLVKWEMRPDGVLRSVKQGGELASFLSVV